METQLMDHCQEGWNPSQVISNYHESDEYSSVQEILKRTRAFKISSKSFQLPTNEKQMKGSSFGTMQTSVGHDFQRGTCYFKYSDMYYPDLSECLDSTLDGSNIMMPFCHDWLLKNRSSEMKRKVTDTDEKSNSPKNSFNKTELKVALTENSTQKPVNGSLDEYEKAIERARQIAEKYSVTEDQITSCDNIVETQLKFDLVEDPKPKPVDKSLDDYEKTIEQARKIAEKYCVTEDPITEATKEKPLTFLEKLKLKADDAPVQISCEKTSDLSTTSYLQKLKAKRDEKILDSSAEICVKTVMNKVKRELHVEAIRRVASKKESILETFENNLSARQQNAELQSNVSSSNSDTNRHRLKVSLLSSAYGVQGMEETKLQMTKRNSWRQRIARLFCVRRHEDI